MNKKDFLILVLISLLFTTFERIWTYRDTKSVCVVTQHEVWNTNSVFNINYITVTNAVWKTNTVWETNIATVFLEREIFSGIPLDPKPTAISIDLKESTDSVATYTNFNSISTRLKQLLDKYDTK